MGLLRLPGSRIPPWSNAYLWCNCILSHLLHLFQQAWCMVLSCIVPGCSSRSNKVECKGIVFTLPTTQNILQIWLLLIGRKSAEVSFHSRICRKHFIGGEKTRFSARDISVAKRLTVRDQSVYIYMHTPESFSC